jgi:hypothetical protein
MTYTGKFHTLQSEFQSRSEIGKVLGLRSARERESITVKPTIARSLMVTVSHPSQPTPENLDPIDYCNNNVTNSLRIVPVDCQHNKIVHSYRYGI